MLACPEAKCHAWLPCALAYGATGVCRLSPPELELAARRGTALPSAVHVGVMLEVPSLYFQLAALLPRIDFLSVGSNDLQQSFFAGVLLATAVYIVTLLAFNVFG